MVFFRSSFLGTVIYYAFCWLVLFHLSYVASSLGQTELENIQLKINNLTDEALHPYSSYETSFNMYLKNELSQYVGTEPVFIYNMRGVMKHTRSFGNVFGEYLTAISCAQKTGTHFVGIPAEINTADPKAHENHPYLRSLPTILLHSNPLSREDSIKAMKNECKFSQYPWSRTDEPWEPNIPYLNSVLHGAAVAQKNWEHQSQALHMDVFDTVKGPHADTQPLIPDAAILFRCNDVLRGHWAYGFINWNVYPLIIPRGARAIYILTEPKQYNADAEITGQCAIIVDSLVDYLSALYPQAFVGVRRGHPVEGLMQLTLSPTVICTPSTFCFWPALGHQGDTKIFFGLNTLIQGSVHHRFGDNFHWLSYPPIINFQTAVSNWTTMPLTDMAAKAIEVLKSPLHDRKLSVSP